MMTRKFTLGGNLSIEKAERVKKKAIFIANLAFKAVELSPGENAVRFTFTGNTFSQIYTQVFFYLGILSVLLLFGILQRHIRHTRQIPSGSSGK